MRQFVILAVFLISGVVCPDDEALRECANLHHIEIQHIPNAKGVFENSKCQLRCTVGDQPLSLDAINEGFACPLDPAGKCHLGKCEGGDSALVECGKLHHLDFKKINNKGSEFANSNCQLTCAIDGNVMSTNALHENAACPGNSKGVCKKGKCVTDGSIPDPEPETTTEPGVTPGVTDEPVGPTVPTTEVLSKVKIDEVEFKIKAGKFNEDIERPYADLCVSTAATLETTVCQQICYSNEITSTTKEPAWAKDCTAMKASSDPVSYIYVAVYSKKDEKFIGNVRESLNQLFAQHYKASDSDSVSFERQFPVQYFGTTVGHIGIDVKIKFSKK